MPETRMRSSPMIDYLAILDFEATCDDTRKLKPQEIIEFPTVFVNTSTGNIDYTFHTYVRPEVHPTLTTFCTQLTGITQDKVNNGIVLEQALREHQEFLDANRLMPAGDSNYVYLATAKGINSHSTFLYVTCGDWDLQTCLPRQLEYLHQTRQHMPSFSKWCNIKKAFGDLYGVKAKGMTSMLTYLQLELQGRHHSGIDDCKNLARIAQQMLKDGWEPGSKKAPAKITTSAQRRPDTSPGDAEGCLVSNGEGATTSG